MNRRDVLIGTAATLFAGRASAELQCTPYNYDGVAMCEAGVPGFRATIRGQRAQNWCWAACIQGIFEHAGVYVEQEAIVYKLFGDLRDRPASPRQILYAVDGVWSDAYGRTFRAASETITDFSMGVWRPDAGAAAAHELAAGYPLINGAVRHATLLTSMKYYVNTRGQGMPFELTVRDPWPGNGGRRRLSDEEVRGTNFLARVRVF